ncbi:DUF2934 domain-containing protein [Methylobacterium sp. GC_Met_2]|uniref:DUF2934 domain-containing protein n=1 Tax=Methylobacterium sp. GC_Met_2 TaxID=2937376 RepID=UPI00226B22B5|nr:DUF2934 domain-containing protein [Methylobacterium sp. GC_Met_2]
MEPDDQITDEQIRARAHDIWDRHHRPEGYDLQFWLLAKRELEAVRKALPDKSKSSTKESVPDLI